MGLLVHQINFEKLRVKKLISLFEPLYLLSENQLMKKEYGKYVKKLKDNLNEINKKEEIENGKNR